MLTQRRSTSALEPTSRITVLSVSRQRRCRAAPTVVVVDTDLSTARPVLRAPVVAFLTFAAALGTATLYPLQPSIAEVAGSLDVPAAVVGTVLACGPLGYLAGLAVLVPLVDRFPPRTVVAAQFAALAVALALATAVGSAALLGLVLAVIGAGSAVGAQLSSVAGRFAEPRRRATVLGVVPPGSPRASSPGGSGAAG